MLFLNHNKYFKFFNCKIYLLQDILIGETVYTYLKELGIEENTISVLKGKKINL